MKASGAMPESDPTLSAEGRLETPLQEPTQAGPALGEAAVSGGLWTIGQVAVVKVVSIGGMLVLMHLLPPDLFGVASLALSVQAMVTLLQPLTMGDVVLARSADLGGLSATAHRIAMLTSVGFALAVAAIGPWMSQLYRAPALAFACALAALRPIAEAMVVLPLTRLRAQLRFRIISTVDALTLAGGMIGSVVMALLGFGIVSIILPPIAFTMLRGWLYRRALPAAPSSWRSEDVRPLFRRFALSGLGQYVHAMLFFLTPLVVGVFTGKRDVGWYTIAFTMSAQINAVVGFGMGLVLQPIFVQMAGEPARQAAAFLRACRLLATLAMPVCLLQAVLAPAAFRLLLPESWAGAIVLTQILSIGQAFFFGVNPAIGLLKAQGRFGAYMAWQTIQLVVVVGAMFAAGWLWREAPLVPIVLVAGLYHCVFAPIGVWIATRGRGASLATTLGIFLRPLALAVVSVLPLTALLSRIVHDDGTRDVLSLTLLPIVTLVIFGLLLRLLDRAMAEDCARLARSILRRLPRARASAA